MRTREGGRGPPRRCKMTPEGTKMDFRRSRIKDFDVNPTSAGVLSYQMMQGVVGGDRRPPCRRGALLMRIIMK